MFFDHVGLMNEDEEGAVRFYSGILGMEKTRESSVPAELSRRLFSADIEIKMLVFGKEDLKVEVFIVPRFKRPSPSVPHFCFLAQDLPGLIGKAEAAGVKVVSAERGGRTVWFVEDFSGNRIEIKPAA